MRQTDNARLAATLEGLEARRLMSVTYYVSPTGGDSASGDAGHPFKTIQQGVYASNPGDTVDVRPGTYAGFVLGWDGNDSGTAAAPVTFHAEPGAVVASRNARTPDGIDVEGSSYVVIEGFTVNNSSGSITRAGIRSVANTNVVLRGNVVTGCGNWGIFTGFSENVDIENNVASGSIHQHGIYVSNSADNPVVRGNTCFGNARCGIQINADGSQGGDGVITHALVEDNVLYDNASAGGSGMNFDGVQDSVVRDNLLYDNHASGISLYQIDGNAPSMNNVVANNTIVMPQGSRWALNIQNGSTGNAVYNNVLYDANPRHGAIDISADSLPGFKSDYNAVDGRFTTDDGNSVLSPADWTAATGQDAHSFVAAPAQLFADPAGNDYHLKAGSPAAGAGTTTDAPPTDLDGNARVRVDIGAYALAQGRGAGPVSLFAAASAPTDTASTDTRPAEVGVRFHADADGSVTSIRFYKGPGNTGVHNGHLWTAGGRLLARAKFKSETATGWQEATFATPVKITAGRTYVASYHAKAGHYADDAGTFASAGLDVGPLHVDAEGMNGPSSVFAHGKGGKFPSRDGAGANYWVDVVFIPSVPPAAAPSPHAFPPFATEPISLTRRLLASSSDMP